jgi:uncharacterized protein
MDVHGRTALVTGASRGIGRELARALSAAGAVPVLVARDESALRMVANETGGHVVVADLADSGQVAKLWQRAQNEAGPIDLLVNNAGAASASDLPDEDWAEVERMFQVNVLAPMRLCQDAIRSMTPRRRGHLVNVSSVAGAVTMPGMAAYATSKAALNHFTALLRTELRGLPIGTTLVELGPVPTDMLRHVKEHPPTGGGFRRMYSLRLIVDVPAATAATAIVDAVRSDRRHVRLPRRAAPLALLAEAPRRASDWALTGVPRRST